jgi:peptide deformylase
VSDQPHAHEAEHPEPAEPGVEVEPQPAEEGGAPAGIDDAARERRRAALAEVVQFGDPVLNSRASEIADFDPALQGEAERMIGIMREAMGIGLAATQLGVMRRMLVFQAGPDAEPRALVNPEVEWTSEELVTAEEGCLSLAGVVVDVELPLYARVRAHDVEGNRLLLEASGLEARVLQHEIDHLDGVLILDRTPREQRRAALRALREGGTFFPEMLDPDYDPEAPADAEEPADEPGEGQPAERSGE